MNILITGAAGFIGYHLSKQLLEQGNTIIGVDNLNAYYDVKLKQDRLTQLQCYPHFSFEKLDIADNQAMVNLFKKHTFDTVINLAAQAGVRYSLQNPQAYIDSNIVGFSHLIENCRKQNIKHFIFASSSSVYGANAKQPFSEHDDTNHPLALYAATKKANEVIAHSYASLYQLPCTGLRFFTVYGPWGRPDMALFKFTQNILNKQPIDVYHHGNMIRDFTYIDDLINGILPLIHCPARANPHWSAHHPDPASSYAPFQIYNIGSNQPIHLSTFIESLEKALSKKAKRDNRPLQAGDTLSTCADINKLKRDFGYCPKQSIESGIQAFVKWYLTYYKISRD